MLLNFFKADFREKTLIDKYLSLISEGVKPSEILVLVQNSTLKNRFANKILSEIKIDAIEKLNIHSFFSVVYSTLNDNWCFLENLIKGDTHYILPHLVGLEVSQFLLKDILKQLPVKGYNSKKSLLHQLIRRYALITQNNLSEEDVNKRAEILKESFADDAKKILKTFHAKTFYARSFDYLRQINAFNYVYENTRYFEKIKYLLIDDADEMTPVCFKFIEYLRPQLKDWLICFDSSGSSRCGYLSADTSVESKLKKIFNEEITDKDEKFTQGEKIFSNVVDNKHEILENFTLISLSKRAEILDSAIAQIKKFFQTNVKPSEITVITPLQDEMLKFTLCEKLEKSCSPIFLSGNEKLNSNPLVKASLTILKLMLNLEVGDIDLRSIISDYIGIPLKYSDKILEGYKNSGSLPKIEIEFYNEKYQNFLSAFDEIKNKKSNLSTKVCEMFYKVVDYTQDININKFNFFIKELKDFENVLTPEVVIERAEEIINQFENSIIAENPVNTGNEFEERDLIVATPQKIIDSRITSKYQIWLDVSHSDWVKTDTGPLYNAWVMQADWSKDEYTVEDDIFLSRQKTARILRKLLLLADNVYAYSSLFDPQGTENLGGIESYLAGKNQADTSTQAVSKIVPRDDQKPVLKYQKGSMAISAVPGAGKTTILLALIMKLLENNVKPENIYVLTYMDSAARNFREKIKNMCPNSTSLPNISTIHGLALRILKENSNFERLNLSADFDICDDTQRMKIIKSIAGKNSKNDIEDFERAISVLKLQEGNIDCAGADKKMERFKTFYNQYQTQLKEANMIDYDDILIMSVKLLENNPDILLYYQDTCKFIIEDEAQDSSGIQQRLLGLLSGRYKNLIRCGDINQAITTTFSNADVEGFRKFIETAETKVEMNCSQRCTQEVMNLANKVVEWGSSILPKAFYKSFMKGVEGKNPVQQNAVFNNVFENPFAERNYILKEIKNILTKDNNATIGILVRSNFQAGSWTSFINDAGLKTITRSESLGQKAVFNTIFAILQFVRNPFDNEVLASTYEVLAKHGFYTARLQTEIKKSEKPFIQKDDTEIEQPDLVQFLWDMQYWLNSSTLPLEELATRIGLYYYTSDIEKSNVYLIAILVKRLNSNSNFDLTMQRLEELAKRPSLSGFKFFSEEEDKDAVKGKVQIMTYHKSKGDEFDYVFLPELTERSLSIDSDIAKLKASTFFMEEVRGLNTNYKKKTEPELIKFNCEESLRLLYVAITRAKRKLYITCSDKVKSFGKDVPQEPSIIFEDVLGC